jgi:Chromosome segregation ATPases
MDELDEVYSEWDDTVNMTASELERWSGNPCSREASVDPEAVIERNLELLQTNKSDWTEGHIDDAKRTISFVNRMRGARGEGDQKSSGTHDCPTDWAISLLNWAYNPFDDVPDIPDNDNLDDVSKVELMSMIREGMRFFSVTNDTMIHVTETDGDMVRVKSGPESKWMEKAQDVIEKVGEGTWKYAGMKDMPKEEEMAESPIPMPEDAQLLYPNEEKAMEAAEEMDMSGTHPHELDGETWYMPASTHEKFVEKMKDLGEMEDLAEAEMVLASYGMEDDEEEMADAPEYSEGDMVQWEVMPDLFGQVVHNPMDEPVIMVEVMEKEDGDMMSTHHTISAYPSDIEHMESMDELAGIEIHSVDFSGTTEGDWSKPDMEDFDTDDLSEIDDHFLVSKTGFPPENYGDLALPVVGPEGDLYLNALQNAKARGSQVEGLSGEDLDNVMTMINSLANDNFDADFEEMGDLPTVNVLTGDDFRHKSGKSEESELDDITTINTMTQDIEEKLAELSEPVAVEQDDLEELQEKADRFEEMSESLSALKDRTEVLDEVDRSMVEELAEADEPVVVESTRMEQLESEAEQVAETYATELAEESFLSADELTDKFSIEELREKFEEQIGDPAEELGGSENADPKSADIEEEELEQRAGESNEELAPSETEEAEQKREELRNKIIGN